MKKEPFVLAISSYAVHGTASLKTFISVLGHRILPVPSKILNGLTNMSLVKTFDPPFEELLNSSLELALNRNLELIFYIGYLGAESQVDIILKSIEKYKSIIQTIIVDPVSGDHGRMYVSELIVSQWSKLISKADFVFPNLTELKIHSQHKPTDLEPTEFYIKAFKNLFPIPTLIAKSVELNGSIGVNVVGNYGFSFYLEKLTKSFGGSGDLFLAHFILNHYYKKYAFEESIQRAICTTHDLIKKSIVENSDDLILDIL